jgi:hypothetical protein
LSSTSGNPPTCVALAIEKQESVQFTYFGISGVGIEHVRKEFTCAGHTGNHETMNVEAIDNEKV